MADKQGKDKGNWLPKAVMFLGVVVIVLISVAIFKESYRKKQIQAEINALQQEVDKIQKDNAGLSDKITYLGSGDFQEKEAKDKLNLQKPGENLVIVQPEQSSENRADVKEEAAQQIIVKVSNPEKWWKYFFEY